MEPILQTELMGLAAGTSVVILGTLAFFAYLSGNIIFADYLNIMFLPNMGETTIFAVALIGATIGFFWYNTYPAQVFMGDTGSLMLGGVICSFGNYFKKRIIDSSFMWDFLNRKSFSNAASSSF